MRSSHFETFKLDHKSADRNHMGIKKNWGDIPEWIYGSTQSILQTFKKSDPETHAHCLRVGEYSRKLARDAGLSEYQQKLAEFTGLLHDVGKSGVEKTIIHKPGRLTEEEMAHMRNHPIYSAEIIKPLVHHEFFAQIQPAIRAHHERVDGEGYPDKLRGEEVPLLSRIVLVVDTLDAMGFTRAYRKGLPTEVIYKELERCSGTQFDPQLVKIFLQSHKYWATEGSDPITAEKVIKKVA